MVIIAKRKIITALSLLIIIFTTILVGCVDQSQVAKPVDSSFVIKSASEAGLKIDDLPTGWMLYDKIGNETYYKSIFDKQQYGRHLRIISQITKYPTINDAEKAYSNLKNENSEYKLVSMGIGDESFGLEYDTDSLIVFRKSEIIVETMYSKEYGSSSIGDAKEYAEIVEKKIE